MTKERKLAIQMWEEIKNQLPYWNDAPTLIANKVKRFKGNFCTGHHLYWDNCCWLCEYFKENCAKCPLRSCNYKDPATAWARLVLDGQTLEIRIAACDEIIAALKGDKRK